MTDNKLISTDKHESKLKDLSQIIEDSWLGISIDYDTLSNPLLTFPPHLHDKPHLWLAYLMSRPEYFSFMGREIFNIEFLPFQTTILKEMWENKFPMLIGTRGMSKCVTGNTRIVTQKGIRRIRDVVGETGGHEERIYLKDEKVYTENNKWIGVEYGWKNRRDKTLKLTVNCGLQIEVKYDHKIRVVPKGMKDEDIVWRPANEIKKGDRLLVQCPQENLSRMPGLEITDEALEKKILQFSEQRGIPGEFWQFNLKQSNIFISYLLDKFSVRKGDRVAFIFTDTDLLRELQLYIYYYTGFLFYISPLGVLECDFSLKIREKFLDEVTSIESGESITYDLHLKSDHTYLSNGFVSHNSFTLGMYALLRAALLPGRKVVIVGSVFRQSKIIFQYIDTIYQNSGRLREMLGNNRPKKSPDKWELSVGSSLITAIPVGCLATDTLITTDDGIYEMGEFSPNNCPSTIYSVDRFKDVGFFHDNGIHDCKKIATKCGYSFTGTYNHKMRVLRNGEVVWCRSDEMVVGDRILIDSSKRWFNSKFPYRLNNKQMYEVGIELSDTSKSYYDRIPSGLLSCSKDNVRHLIKGLMDAAAFIDKTRDGIWFTSKHEKLVNQLHYIFLHFGLVAGKTFNSDRNEFTLEMGLCDYIHAFDDEYWQEENHEKNNVFYDSITNIEDVPSVYTVDLNVPEDNTYTANGFISHNTGDSIRGLRSNDILADEFSSQNREIFENVIAGFNAVSSSPVQKVKEYYQNKIRETLGVELEDAQDDYFPDNQLILSGTAYYYFNHFAQYWERWRSIINSKGDIEKLREVFNGEIPEDLDWRDFSVIRVPVELLPKGYMDQANLARSKATLSSHLYDMEFSACSTADTPIQTLEGVKQIIDVQPGKDKVLTHTGEFKTVEKLTHRPYSGELLEFTYKRSPFTYKFTPDHPFFCENKGFIELEDILYKRGQLSSVADNNTVSNIYVPPKRKKTKKEKVETLDIRNYVNEDLYLEYNNQLFTYSDTQTNVTRKRAQQIIDLHENNSSLTSISKITSCSIEQITKVIDIVRGGGGLPQDLELDYELGRFIGLFSICGSFTDESDGEFVINFKQLNKANEIAKSLPGSQFGSRSHFLFYSNITAFTKFCEQKIGISSKKIKKVSRHQVSFTDKFTRDLLFNLMSRPPEPSDFILQPVLLFCNENFIRGYFHTLFCLSYKQLNKIKIKNTVCTNRKIIEQVKLMAEYLGLSPILNIDGRDNSKKFLSFNTYDSYKILEHIFLEKTGYFENLRKVSPIRNELGNIERQISSFKRIPYEGMIYNLEVEGDHSYSTPDATMHNCFSKDSNGFFKASLIESCTANEINDIQVKVGEDEYETVIYDPRMYGDRSKEYVFGIDPASEVDKFAIVILELHENHCRIVHVWTTNAEKFKRQKRAGIDIAIKDDYYSYCSRKIRDLMKRFPCTRICLDAQGGGKAISEALRDQDNIQDDEQKIWPIINPEKSQDTDGENGLHILELVQFASYEYTRDANHGLRKDFEDRKCLFPRYNPAALAYATATNPSQHDEMEIEEISIYDTMEDNFMEIQELKKELSQIVVTLTGGGREKFDTPEVKISGSEKGRARKDRYSALVMANAGARKIIRGEDGPGFIQTSFERPSADDKNKDSGFIGPSWAANKLDGLYG